MFAPNRLLTLKEQWLLIGVAGAVLLGSATLFLLEHQKKEYVLRDQERGNDVRLALASTSAPAAPLLGPAQSAPIVSVPEVYAAEFANTEPSAELAADANNEVIGVAIMGAVHMPGLYMMPASARVSDLLVRAGGANSAADLTAILLTAPLVDETTLTIPALPRTSQTDDAISVRQAQTRVVNPPQYCRYAMHKNQKAVAANSRYGPEIISQPTGVIPVGNDERIDINQATAEQLQTLPGIGPVLANRIIEERQRQLFINVDDLLRVPGIGEKRLESLLSLIVVR